MRRFKFLCSIVIIAMGTMHSANAAPSLPIKLQAMLKDLQDTGTANYCTEAPLNARSGCIAQYDQFCEQLFSKNAGKLDVAHGNQITKIRYDLSNDKPAMPSSADYARAKSQFDEIKTAYLNYLKTSPDFSEDQRVKLLDGISGTELMPLSQTNLSYAKMCENEKFNSFYSPDVDQVGICPALIDSGQDLSFIFAHEISHAFGMKRSMTIAFRESELEVQTHNMIQNLCTQKPPDSCTAELKKFLADTPRLIKALSTPALPFTQLRQCLSVGEKLLPIEKKHAVTPEYTKAIASTAKANLTNRLDKLSTSDICSDPKPLEGDEPGGAFSLKAVLKAEQLCGNKTDAYASTLSLMEPLEEFRLRFGGNLSTDRTLNAMGFSQDTEERLADALASEVFSRRVKDKKEGLSFVFANTANFCESVNVNSGRSQEESPHPENSERRALVFNPLLMQTLGCKNDNPTKVCKIGK